LTLVPTKVSAPGLVFSNETLMAVDQAGQNFINREILSELARSVDAAFLNIIATTAGIVSIVASGVTGIDAHHDLKTALLAVGVGQRSKYYWLASPDVCKKISALPDSTGGSAFPVMSATNGGELLNLPCLVATGVPAGSLYLIDASAIATDAVEVGVDVGAHTNVQMDSSPTMSSAVPTPTATVSMFATNSVVLRAFTMMGVTALRTNAASVITSINWG
jgi:HK97 family phage major capsid protein